VDGVLPAKFAILVHFKTIGIVLLVLDRVVIPLLAFGAGHCDLYSHRTNLLSLSTHLKIRVETSNSAISCRTRADHSVFRALGTERSIRIPQILPAVNRFFTIHFLKII
jgi:hypothetical protein